MKKQDQILEQISAAILLLFFPIPSFMWYKDCKKRKDSDYEKFLSYFWFGLLALAIIILGLISFFSYKPHSLVLMLIFAPYVFVFYLFITLAAKKSRAERKKEKIIT